MYTFRTFASILALIVAFGFNSTEALANKHVTTDSTIEATQTTLSGKEALDLAKSYLPRFLEVDSNITLRELKQYILSLNTIDLTEIDSAMQSYLLSLQPVPVNQAPTIGGTPATEISEGNSYGFTPVASDPEGDSLIFSIANKPAWATFDSTTGSLSGTPQVGSAGSYGNILISVSDGALSDALPAFAIVVNPIIVYGAPTLLSAEVSASNVVLAWIQENSVPEGGYDIFIDGVDTGALYRTTTTSQAIGGLDLTQAHCFTVEARYTNTGEFFPSNQLCSEAQLPPNQAPSISGNPTTVISEGDSYSFTPVASDPEGDSLTFSIANKPAWATFDSGTGSLSGTPQVGSAGSYGNILISVSDGALSDTLPAFEVVVNPTVVYGAPTLISADVSAADVVLTWTQENSVPEGGYDVFIDGVDTGPLYRTTATSVAIGGLDLAQTHCFTVESRYTNTGEFFSSNQVCSEAQAPANQPPVIGGTPSTEVLVGDSYLFAPSSSDADGDTLSFTILNAPAWASFDNQTGSLSGTPQVGDEGSYTDIEIRVSDGQSSASLTPFTLVVGAVQTTGSATLSWIAPATRIDGSSLSLSEIDGYRIYMGDSESALEPVMDLNDNSITQYTLSNIAVGTHFYSITAYDVDGQESDLSNIVSKSTL